MHCFIARPGRRRRRQDSARGLHERVEQRRQLRRAVEHGLALARHGALVAAGDRAGERGSGAVLRPVLDRGAHERGEQLARDARGGGEPLGGALEHVREALDAHRRREAGRVDLLDRGREQDVDAERLGLGGIALHRARVGGQVARLVELRRVDEQGHDHLVARL
ncbi:MAG TPA: hypothetical protein VFX93_00225, partial [Xanthomonadaceae bacterium]|nr:hypothetical protein [Xanthomonadaceae bacterium]